GEGQGDLAGGGEVLGESAEGLLGDLVLVLEDGHAELIAGLLGLGVEEAGEHGSRERPVVLGQREVVADQGDFVGGGGFFEQGRGAAAVRTLQVLENNQRDLRARRRTQRGILRALGGKRGRRKENDRQKDRLAGHHG